MITTELVVQDSQLASKYSRLKPDRFQQLPKLSNQQHKALIESQRLWHGLALRLLHSAKLADPWAVGVTSSINGEGKTLVSIGLATALARETNTKVALIEANFENPTLARDYGVDGVPGLTGCLTESCQLSQAGKMVGDGLVTLFTAGNVLRPGGGLTVEGVKGRLRHQLPQILRQLGEEFPRVVLDLPPLLGSIDAEDMLRHTDGTILVVRAGVTPLEKFTQAAESLDKDRLLGVVQLGDQTSIPGWLSRMIAD